MDETFVSESDSIAAPERQVETGPLTSAELSQMQEFIRRAQVNKQIGPLLPFINTELNSVQAGGSMASLITRAAMQVAEEREAENTLDRPLESYVHEAELAASEEYRRKANLESLHNKLNPYLIAYSAALHRTAEEAAATEVAVKKHGLYTIETSTVDEEGNPEYFCRFAYRFFHDNAGKHLALHEYTQLLVKGANESDEDMPRLSLHFGSQRDITSIEIEHDQYNRPLTDNYYYKNPPISPVLAKILNQATTTEVYWRTAHLALELGMGDLNTLPQVSTRVGEHLSQLKPLEKAEFDALNDVFPIQKTSSSVALDGYPYHERYDYDGESYHRPGANLTRGIDAETFADSAIAMLNFIPISVDVAEAAY